MDKEKLERFGLVQRAVHHIRAQGEASVKKDGSCRYALTKGGKTLHCAAWPFITAFTITMNGACWDDVVDNFPKRVDPLAIKYHRLVTDIQNCHDISAEKTPAKFMETFEENIKDLCKVHDLPYGEL